MAKFEHYEQGTPSWIELMTPDQAAAQAFYGDLFGWSFDDHDMGEMGHYYIPKVEGDEIGGISGQMPGMEGHPAFWGVYLAVDDVDAATAKVEAARREGRGRTVRRQHQRPDVGDPGPDRCARRPVAGPRHDRHRARQRARHPDLERVRDTRHRRRR